MAIIHHFKPQRNYYSLHNGIVKLRDLSDQGFRLYSYVGSHRNGFDLQEKTIMKALDWSDKKVRRYKKELVLLGFLYMEKVGMNSWHMWIGNMEVSAENVMKIVKGEESDSAIDISEVNRLRTEYALKYGLAN